MALVEGSCIVISGVISPLIRVIITVSLLITSLITTHEPPSSQCNGSLGVPSAASFGLYGSRALLGGSWVVISGVIIRLTIVITHIRGLITPVITTHEPPRSDAERLVGPRAFVSVERLNL